VRDRLDGEGTHALAWRFHLDPAVAPQRDGCDVRLTCGGKTVWVLPDETAATFSFSIEPGWVSPSYGVKLPTNVLVWKATAKIPVAASYLFADAHFSSRERRVVSEAMSESPAS
jgi:hypothetical protein